MTDKQSDSDGSLMVCERAGTPNMVPTPYRAACCECGVAVQMSLESYTVWQEAAGPHKAICLDCYLEGRTEADMGDVQPLSLGQMKEMLAALFPRPKGH